MSVGDRIRSIREDRGYTQHQLATLLNVSAGSLSKYETGKMQIPVDIIVKAADIFEVSVDYVLERTEFPFDYNVYEKTYIGSIKTKSIINDILTLNKNNRATLSDVLIGLKLKNNAESIKSRNK